MKSEIIDSMARTLHVLHWAEEEEEQGNFYPGEDLMEIAPETPEEALYQAWRLCGMIESMNGASLERILVFAAEADGFHTLDPEFEYPEGYARELGYCLAMRALGHGVAWEDNHPPIILSFPTREYKSPYFDYSP